MEKYSWMYPRNTIECTQEIQLNVSKKYSWMYPRNTVLRMKISTQPAVSSLLRALFCRSLMRWRKVFINSWLRGKREGGGRLQNRRSPQCGSGGGPHHGKLRHWSETERNGREEPLLLNRSVHTLWWHKIEPMITDNHLTLRWHPGSTTYRQKS